jgi:hypothetical protein
MSPMASSTPVPGGVVDPQALVQKVTRLNGIVLRVDDVATKLMPSTDYPTPGASVGLAGHVPTTIWVVAVLGEIRPSFGVMARPNSPCGLFAFRADTGEIWSTGGGPLSACQPYFARSLAPSDAPVRCAATAYDNGVPRDLFIFSATRPGAFGLSVVRDDRWRQPTSVSGAFLMHSPEGSVTYEDAYCLRAVVRRGPTFETLLASGVGAAVPAALPPFERAIWLRGYHAIAGSADGAGHIDVVVEPRAGYEWAFFDWDTLVPDGGYVMFRFVDASGREVLPWRLANGP